MKFGITMIMYLVFFCNCISQLHPKYELRGTWIATVKNIDWPSKPGLSSYQQQREALQLLDLLKSQNINTIFLQVRPSSDAIYPSELEPWSPYLSGKSGQAPEKYYDPLAFWIYEAHKRGIELHAWINPFRATMSLDEDLDNRHPVKQHPEWFIEYNNKLQYDPGNPECRIHIAQVVQDIVKRYDVDGIHMDDYFYPYPVSGLIFNDSTSFVIHNPEMITDIGDWRRHNVDETVALLQKTIKNIKPYVAFGISPFGVWRNADKDSTGSLTKAGITNYDDLYADILKWMKEKDIDYVVPQIYWDTGHKTANFSVLAKWWSDHSYSTPVFIGHGLYRVGSDNESWKNPSQMLDQLRFLRDSSKANGSVYFSAKHFKRDLLGFQDSLKAGQYKYPSLNPELIRNINDPVITTDILVKKRFRKIKWECENLNVKPSKFVVYIYQSSDLDPLLNSENIYNITGLNEIKLNKKLFERKTNYYIKIEAIDHYDRSCGLSLPVKKRF